MTIWKWLLSLWPWYTEPLHKQTDLDLLETYFRAGTAYAEVYLDLEFGTADDYHEILQAWVEAESEMLGRNFCVFPLDTFIRAYTGRQDDLDGLGERIPPDIAPISYAKRHREEYVQRHVK